METLTIGNIEKKQFISVNTWISAFYNNSSALKLKYWRNLFSDEQWKSCEHDEEDYFVSFDKMLNHIENNTDYTLFQLIPYDTGNERRLKLVYIHK